MSIRRALGAAAVTLAAGTALAACGSSSGAPAVSPPAAAPSPRATAAAAVPVPAVTAQGAAYTECSQFESVYQQIVTATKGAGQIVLPGILGRHANGWSDALSAASQAATPTRAGVDIGFAGNFVGMSSLAMTSDDGTLALSDWSEAAGQLKKAQADCTGQ